MAERDIAKACTRRWDALGLLYRRVQWIGRNSAPDFVVMGVKHRAHMHSTTIHVVWVETKPEGGKPTELQRLEHDRMAKAGQVVLVINSLEALDRWFPL